MSVPKNKRSTSKFEAFHHFFKLRDEVTDMILNDFGFSEEKYLARIEKYRSSHMNSDNIDAIVERWKAKNESFKRWFIDEEGCAIIDIMREMQKEFTIANSIYPSSTHAKLMEWLTRRFHINKAIGLCYSLKQELQYVIRTLPVDINKYERFDKLIEEQIALYKGVRKSDNRLIKQGNEVRQDSLTGVVSKAFKSLADVIHKISETENE